MKTKGKKPAGRLQHASVLYKDKLFVFGGEPNQLLQLNDLFMYQINKKSWIELKPKGIPPTPRVSTSALIYDDVIYFFGGYDGETWKSDIFVYDIDRNEWDQVKTKN